jgi:hypothetical protein
MSKKKVAALRSAVPVAPQPRTPVLDALEFVAPELALPTSQAVARCDQTPLASFPAFLITHVMFVKLLTTSLAENDPDAADQYHRYVSMRTRGSSTLFNPIQKMRQMLAGQLQACLDTALSNGCVGLWAFVAMDCLQDYSSGRPITFSDGALFMLKDHPGMPVVTHIPPQRAELYAQTFRSMKDDLIRRKAAAQEELNRAPAQPVPISRLDRMLKTLEALDKLLGIADKALDLYDRFVQRQEQLRREQLDDEMGRFMNDMRNSKALDGASDHVDRFERNRGWIERTA